MSLTVGLDVGGTKVAAGVVDDRGAVIEKLRRPTPAADPEQIARMIAEVVSELRGRHQIEAVGIGAAGFVNESRTAVLFAPHLAWRDDPLEKRVESLVRLPVVIDNDANASVWAEARFGAARGQQNVVLLAIGTGIGGGLMLGGQLYRGRWGMAGRARSLPGRPGRPPVRLR